MRVKKSIYIDIWKGLETKREEKRIKKIEFKFLNFFGWKVYNPHTYTERQTDNVIDFKSSIKI